MKNIIFILLLALFSCNKKSDPQPSIPINGSGYYMTCSLNGTAWSAEILDNTTGQTEYVLSGQRTSSNPWNEIDLYFPKTIVAGTYTMKPGASWGADYVFNGGNANHQSYIISGTLTIISISNTETEGTFSFISDNLHGDTVRATDGKFKLKL